MSEVAPGTVPPVLTLHDTRLGRTEFHAGDSDVTVYVCGVTPYDTAHLGHAFTYVSFDVLIRYLQFLGHGVRYIQNVTDLDDPLYERANRLGVHFQSLAREQFANHLGAMAALNVLPADRYPHASRELEPMVALVATLLETGHAYRVDQHVYFSIATDPEYGSLSKYNRAAMIELARERGGDPDDPRRRDPLDFVLWRPSSSGEPSESSPWGDGLPGWHLECSAMALKYLGAPLDIHGGGSDLIFPHHENEIAQSEQATGIQPFARYWLHTGMVHLGGTKMSKSLGNMVFAGDLIERFGPNAVRLYISGCHYRGELEYTDAGIEAASKLAESLEAAMCPGDGSPTGFDPTPFRRQFLSRLSDDLDTPGAIAALSGLAEVIAHRRAAGYAVRDAQSTMRELGDVLGLTFSPY